MMRNSENSLTRKVSTTIATSKRLARKSGTLMQVRISFTSREKCKKAADTTAAPSLTRRSIHMEVKAQGAKVDARLNTTRYLTPIVSGNL